MTKVVRLKYNDVNKVFFYHLFLPPPFIFIFQPIQDRKNKLDYIFFQRNIMLNICFLSNLSSGFPLMCVLITRSKNAACFWVDVIIIEIRKAWWTGQLLPVIESSIASDISCLFPDIYYWTTNIEPMLDTAHARIERFYSENREVRCADKTKNPNKIWRSKFLLLFIFWFVLVVIL